jgi:hypothetical protein
MWGYDISGNLTSDNKEEAQEAVRKMKMNNQDRQGQGDKEKKNEDESTTKSEGMFRQIGNRLADGAVNLEGKLNGFMYSDPLNLRNINTGPESTIHNLAKGLLGLVPVFSVPNAFKILATDKDFYDSEAKTKTDKVMAVTAIVSPLNPGANLSKKLLGNPAIGELLDGFNTFMQFSNDIGALNGLKQRIHKEESAKRR